MSEILRLSEFWDAMQERLDTRRMREILGGRGRVYKMTDEVKDIEAEPTEPWGRILMMPRTTLWPQQDEPGDWKNVAWLMSVQFNAFRARGYDVDIPIAAAHEELRVLLDNWVPDPQPSSVLIAVPVWRTGTPPVHPVFDQGRNLWLSNAEYRTQVVPREV
jgi:hypothetical protein